MKRLFLSTSIFVSSAALPAVAYADTVGTCVVDASGNTYCDPTAFHVTGPGAGTSQDPVIIQSATSFSVIDNSGANTQAPLSLYFAVPVFSGITPAAPTITAATFNGGPITPPAFSAVTSIGQVPSTSSSDLYSAANTTCATINGACNNSVSFKNMVAAEVAEGLGTPIAFNLYSATVNQAFTNKGDEVDLTGTFAKGDIVVPFAQFTSTGSNGKTTTDDFDTSWTNTGFFDATPKCTTECVPVPEPSSLMLLGGAGAAVLGLGLLRRHRP